MALQDGFKVLDLEILANGTGFGNEDKGLLLMKAPGSQSIQVGSDFSGEWNSSAGGRITSCSIISRGKNYSSGSWMVCWLSTWASSPAQHYHRSTSRRRRSSS